MTRLNPYLTFERNAREALEFYRSAFGGELTIDTFASYDMGQDPGDNDLVMHGQLESPSGFVLMASDTPSSMPYTPPAGMSIAINGDDEAELERYWDALAEGSTVNMPFETPPWGGRFGMLTDRFGTAWMLALNAT
ncbi:VOC family protein [Microbacterium sp. LRZ72]|uniref:VOC family protein n=1 Tax=Microbacterium sp. LRZ72 TaxID=2942481 RepID=UPI0029A2781A|nr:VOC family protein [Microbacterium sp. LRZ72]MDX2378049.1 VOC family protein [Microbacterium sp. LRZ72]